MTDDEEMQPTDAVTAPGDYAIPDSTQFMNHFYHWWGEITLAYRVYSALAPGEALPPPARFILPYSDGLQWRDRAGVDGPLMRAAFPSTAIETSYYWDDLMKLNQIVVFERAMIISRPAAHRSPLGGVWFKMIASTMNVSAPANSGSPCALCHPESPGTCQVDSHGPWCPAQMVSSKPGGGRRLRDADHQGLVAALEELEVEGVCETMSIKEQVAAAARSTVSFSVVACALVLRHQIWMPPSPRSTTFEMFNPADYTFDYEILARNMGHRHYAVWNDTFATYPAGTYHEGVNFSDAFHGNDMAVSGAAVARMIRQRLTEPVFT
ncbi:hypothetical protein BD779DRAFT_1529686 [Infundibulicybe gibba]|nr:hypothetical protein BD779DRAFT_1529686 [Infundibulicybe gibba]